MFMFCRKLGYVWQKKKSFGREFDQFFDLKLGEDQKKTSSPELG